MTIVPIKNAVVIKQLIDRKLGDQLDGLGVVSKLLEIIIEKGYGGIGFHSGVEEVQTLAGVERRLKYRDE